MATLTIRRGDAERLKAVENDFLVFATGLRFMAKKRRKDADAEAVIDKTIGDGIVITVAGGPATAAQAQITIDPADTQGLPNRSTPPVKLFYDLVDGNHHTLDTGELIIEPEVLLAI